jgi:hypothetical protein
MWLHPPPSCTHQTTQMREKFFGDTKVTKVHISHWIYFNIMLYLGLSYLFSASHFSSSIKTGYTSTSNYSVLTMKLNALWWRNDSAKCIAAAYLQNHCSFICARTPGLGVYTLLMSFIYTTKFLSHFKSNHKSIHMLLLLQ